MDLVFLISNFFVNKIFQRRSFVHGSAAAKWLLYITTIYLVLPLFYVPYMQSLALEAKPKAECTAESYRVQNKGWPSFYIPWDLEYITPRVTVCVGGKVVGNQQQQTKFL